MIKLISSIRVLPVLQDVVESLGNVADYVGNQLLLVRRQPLAPCHRLVEGKGRLFLQSGQGRLRRLDEVLAAQQLDVIPGVLQLQCQVTPPQSTPDS